MTDQQKLVTAVVSVPDRSGAGLSVLDVAALLERLGAEQRAEKAVRAAPAQRATAA